MIRTVLVALAVLCATPAMADPNCLNSRGSAGLHIGISIGVGGKFTEAEQAQFDIMRARRHGIPAETAERTWLGCLKVTSLDANGHWVTEYYDPYTLERKPLNLRLP